MSFIKKELQEAVKDKKSVLHGYLFLRRLINVYLPNLNMDR